MTVLELMLSHDAWTTRQLLLRCKELSYEQFDEVVEPWERSLRDTFDHILSVAEFHTDFLISAKSESTERDDKTLDGMLSRLTTISKVLTNAALRIEREDAADALTTNPYNGRTRTQGALIAHILTHGMHHRAQVLKMLDQLKVEDVIEGDALSFASLIRGWGWQDGDSYGRPLPE
jgi:uncharacterized damage-inducible protein DinB